MNILAGYIIISVVAVSALFAAIIYRAENEELKGGRHGKS
jgi:hypothetical protein